MCADLFIGIVVLFVTYLAIVIIADNKKQKELKAERERTRIQQANEAGTAAYKNFLNCLDAFYKNDLKGYDELYDMLDSYVQTMKSNSWSIPEYGRQMEQKILYCEKICKELSQYKKKMETQNIDLMINAENYGMPNKEYYSYICSLEKKTIDANISYYETALKKEEYEKIWNVDVREVLNCVWFYALYKPFFIEDFNRAKAIFRKIYRKSSMQVLLGELYAMKQMGGNAVLKDKLNETLNKDNIYQYTEQKYRHAIFLEKPMENIVNIPEIEKMLTILASGLMWMGAYAEEGLVLQYMLKNKIKMTEKLQNRLHSLSNGGGNAPARYEAVSSDSTVYFDVAALAWKDEDYNSFFENAIYQENVLSYSLAVRDENKELFVGQDVVIPDNFKIYQKLSEVFRNEFGSEVYAEIVNGIALSDSVNEKIEGILVKTKQCEQLGIFVYLGRIGKKLNIKFYVLYIPQEKDIAIQKAGHILVQKLSPSVAMWESSLKDTVLMVIQQLLNSNPIEIKSQQRTYEDVEF